MRNRKPRTHYKKPRRARTTVLATIRIVLTASVVALLGMIFYFAWKDGWEAVFAWFGGKYACAIVIILAVAATIAMWLVSVVKQIRSISEDE